MSTKNIEMFVHKVFPQSRGVRIYAACCEGPISIGDSFDLVYELLGHLRINPQEVDFRVESFTAYGQKLDTIDGGLTAEVVLSGQGTKPLKEGDILGTKAFYCRSPRDVPGFVR